LKNLVGRPKVGVLVNNLGASQLNYYLLKEADLNRHAIDIQIFQINPCKPCIPAKAGIFNVGDSFGFSGPLIATSLETAEFMQNCFISKARFFYIFDLFWTRLQFRDYNRLLPLFKNFKLIARSDTHKSIIESAWMNRILFISENFEGLFQNQEIQKYAESSTFFIQS
jgi:hypothetical protein